MIITCPRCNNHRRKRKPRVCKECGFKLYCWCRYQRHINNKKECEKCQRKRFVIENKINGGHMDERGFF